MPKYEDRDDSIRTFVGAFQDAYLKTSHYEGIPFVRDETAQSYFFRIIDFMNPEIWDDSSTNAISKEVVLALLQCAARLYEGGVYTKEAIDLIENEDTRAILSLGIQDNLSKLIHQRCIESIKNESGVTNAENYSRQAGLFSAVRKNKARQLNHQAMIIEHISSLCKSHSAALQNTFDSPKIDEQFMFYNYITLSETLNLYEKSWLVALLPHIFQWGNNDSCSDINRSKGERLAPNLTTIVPGTSREVDQVVRTDVPSTIISFQEVITLYTTQGPSQNANVLHDNVSSRPVDYTLACPWGPKSRNNTSNESLHSPLSHDSATISKELQGYITLGRYKDIQEAFNFIEFSVPSPLITEGDMQHWLWKSTTKERNKLLGICDNWRIKHQHSGSKLSTPANRVLKFEAWIGLLRERAITYRNSASVEAVASVLSGFHTACQKEDGMPFNKEIEKYSRSYNEPLKDRLIPLDSISDFDRNFLESDDSDDSDDDSEYIFPFSPDAHNTTLNSNPVSTPLPHNTNTSGKGIHDRITSAKDIQPTFAIVSPLNASQNITDEDGQYWPRGFDQAGNKKEGLSPIPEEP